MSTSDFYYISSIVEIVIMKILRKRYCKYRDITFLTKYEENQINKKIEDINITNIINDIKLENEKKYKFNFFPIIDKYRINHCGFILVGFYAKNKASFSLRIRDYILCKYELDKDQFVWAFDNKYIIPLISLQCDTIYIDNPINMNDVVLIWTDGNLGTYEQRKLTQYPVYYHIKDNDYIVFKDGYFIRQNNISTILDSPNTRIPEMS
jgi:hypothetical protein